MKSLRAMALEERNGLLLIVLLSGAERREAHLVDLRSVRTTSEKVLQDLHPAISSGEMHGAVPSAVHLVEVRLRVNEDLDHGELVVPNGVAKRRDALEVLRVHILSILQELLESLQIA